MNERKKERKKEKKKNERTNERTKERKKERKKERRKMWTQQQHSKNLTQTFVKEESCGGTELWIF